MAKILVMVIYVEQCRTLTALTKNDSHAPLQHPSPINVHFTCSFLIVKFDPTLLFF